MQTNLPAQFHALSSGSQIAYFVGVVVFAVIVFYMAKVLFRECKDLFKKEA